MQEVDSGERAKKVYEGPRMRNGEEALRELAKTVDHTALKLDATSPVIDGLCSEARTEGFKVCSLPKEPQGLLQTRVHQFLQSHEQVS